MIFDNPIFKTWYTDTMEICRVVPVMKGNVTAQERKKITETPVPCRVYNAKRNGPGMTDRAARVHSEERLACDLGVDIRAGDELLVVRGGALGQTGRPRRYFAGEPQDYYDPVGGTMSGLQHKEVGLLMDEIVG